MKSLALNGSSVGTIEQLVNFTIEYSLAPQMVIFSHGLGVRRDARGMFTDLVANLPVNFGYVLFEYNDDQDENVRTTLAAEEVHRLQLVLDWARRQPTTKHTNLIAHSRGCRIAALAAPTSLRRAVLLAPPLMASLSKQRFVAKPGAVRQGDEWYIPRSDGTISIFPDAVFEEFTGEDPQDALVQWASVQPLSIVLAADDSVVGQADLSHLNENSQISLCSVEDADHDFSGAARPKLIRTVQELLGHV